MSWYTITNCVSVFATITTIGQFLSGMHHKTTALKLGGAALWCLFLNHAVYQEFWPRLPSCRKIMRSKSTGELSCLPFVAALFSCSMWAHYGILKGDGTLILVNIIGLLIQIVYIFVFWTYAVSKNSINHQIVWCVGAVTLIVTATHFLTESSEEAVLYQGLVCCLATCFFCAAPLATLTHVLRSRNTESLPFLWILMTFLVSAEWLVYGCLIQDVFVQFPNFVGMCISGLQLSLFLFFPSQQHGGKVLPTISVQ